MPLCSVIIPVYAHANITKRCLDRLLEQPPLHFERETIVVDDASRDHTAVMLKTYGDTIRVVTHEINLGFSRACNDGASIARGRYLVFLNNDTLPSSGWLDALVEYAENHPEAAVVGSKLLYPNGTIQHAGMAIDADLEPRHLYVGFPPDHPAVNRSRAFPMVTGASFLVRRSAFEALGGFETQFVNGYEDVDLCLRLGAVGREVHYCPASEVVHFESISEGRTDRDAANHALFQRRWRSKLRPSDILYYLEDGLIRLTYNGSAALSVEVAPELGVIDPRANPGAADRLLLARARQVHDLLRENIGLRVRRIAENRPA